MLPDICFLDWLAQANGRHYVTNPALAESNRDFWEESYIWGQGNITLYRAVILTSLGMLVAYKMAL